MASSASKIFITASATNMFHCYLWIDWNAAGWTNFTRVLALIMHWLPMQPEIVVPKKKKKRKYASRFCCLFPTVITQWACFSSRSHPSTTDQKLSVPGRTGGLQCICATLSVGWKLVLLLPHRPYTAGTLHAWLLLHKLFETLSARLTGIPIKQSFWSINFWRHRWLFIPLQSM